MKKNHPNRFILGVVIGLMALLPVLAVLQYHWIGQVSESEVERRRVNLENSASLFGRAFNHELFPAYFAFRISFTGSLEQIERELSLNYAYWASHADHPDLIEDIYWVDYDAQMNLKLYSFDLAAGTLNAIEWPEDLMGWQSYFVKQNQLQLNQHLSNTSQSAEVKEFANSIAKLMVESPAIPIPVSIDDELSTTELFANLNAISSGRAGHTLLTLDRDYLENTFWPQLHQEFFETAGDIDILIVSNTESEQIIYRSNPDVPTHLFDEPDTEVDLSRLGSPSLLSTSRLAFGYASLIDRDTLFADSLVGQVKRAWNPVLQDSFLQADGMTDFPLQAVVQLAQEENYEGELTAEDLLVALTNLTMQEDEPATSTKKQAGPSSKKESKANSSKTVSSDEQLVWTMRLRHKTGSLEASVAATRRRNLALSFSILLILGGAVVMIYTSSRKSRQLAERQMNFVSGVSHELRTPLAVIKSAAANLADGVVNNPERMQKYGQLIQKESNRLTGMVEQVLELAGALSNKQTIDLKPTAPNELIEEALQSCQDTIAEEAFVVEKSLATDLPMVLADARSLRIALSNLISNAMKYSNGSRWIGLRSSLHNADKNAEIQIQVADHGIGIPAEDLPHIFDEFYRSKEVRDAQIKGNGIGLSIVKHTMETHRGRVSVESTSPGTTFTLHFPVHKV